MLDQALVGSGLISGPSLIPGTRQDIVFYPSCYSIYLASLWFTFGAACFLNLYQISRQLHFYGLRRFSGSTCCCLRIHSKMDDACSFYDCFEYGVPKKIRKR